MIPKKGDTVRLAASVTQAEFGLALCDDDGAGLEIDGVVGRVEPHMVNVVIRRLTGTVSISGPTEGSVSRWVRRHEVLEVKMRVKEQEFEKENEAKSKITSLNASAASFLRNSDVKAG